MSAAKATSKATAPAPVFSLVLFGISVFVIQILRAVSFLCYRSESVVSLLIVRVQATRVV